MHQLETHEVYRNAWMSVREDRVRRPDGSTGLFGVVDKPDFALVIPRDEQGGVAGRAVPLSGAPTGLGVPVDHVGHLYAAYGFCSQGFDVYLATGLTAGAPHREVSERDMRQRRVPEHELRDMIRKGGLVDGPSVAAYALLLLHDQSR